jgi:hypothetical protein
VEEGGIDLLLARRHGSEGIRVGMQGNNKYNDWTWNLGELRDINAINANDATVDPCPSLLTKLARYCPSNVGPRHSVGDPASALCLDNHFCLLCFLSLSLR